MGNSFAQSTYLGTQSSQLNLGQKLEFDETQFSTSNTVNLNSKDSWLSDSLNNPENYKTQVPPMPGFSRPNTDNGSLGSMMMQFNRSKQDPCKTFYTTSFGNLSFEQILSLNSACKEQKLNERISEKVEEGTCCPEDVPLCNISELSNKCNQIQDTVFKNNENQTLFSLLSNISLTTQSIEGTDDYNKTQNFCQNCYEEAFVLANKPKQSKNQSKREFIKLQRELTSKLAQEATNLIYRKSTRMVIEQKNLYQHYRGSLERAVTHLAGGDQNKIKKMTAELKCEGHNDLGDFAPQCNADFSRKNLQYYLNSVFGVKRDTPKLDGLSFYEANQFLEKLTKDSTDLLVNKWNSSQSLISNGNQQKQDEINGVRAINFKLITNPLSSVIVNNRKFVKELCDKENFENAGHFDMTKYWNVLVQNTDPNNSSQFIPIGKNKLNMRRELLERQLFSATLINPEFSNFVNNPKQICKMVEGESLIGAYKAFEKMRLDLEESLKQKQQVSFEDDIEIYKQVRKNALQSCLSDALKKEKQKALCGDLKGSMLPLKLNFKELGSTNSEIMKKRMVLSQLQCSHNINVIDTSLEGYKPYNSPEALLGYFGEEDTYGKLVEFERNQSAVHSDLVQKAIDEERSLNINFYQIMSENEESIAGGFSSQIAFSMVNANRNPPISTGSGEDISHGDVIDNATNTSDYTKYLSQNNISSGGGSSSGAINNPYDYPFESGVARFQPSDSGSSGTGVANYSSGENTSDFVSTGQEVFQNYQDEINPASNYLAPTSMDQNFISNQITNNDNYRSLQNKSEVPLPDYSELRDAMKGETKEEKAQNLEKYLASNKPAENLIADNANNSETEKLKRELESLRNTLKSEQKATYDAEMEQKLAGANARIDKLNQMLKSQQKQNSGRFPASYDGGAIDSPSGQAGQGQMSYNDLVEGFPKETLGDIASGRQGFVGSGYAMGNNRLPIQGDNPEVVSLLSNKSSNHQIKFIGDQLTLINGNKSYPLVLKNVRAEGGMVVSFEYDGKEYSREEFKKIGFDTETIEALDKLAKNKQTKNFAEVVEFGIQKELEKSKEPTERFYSYANLKCITLIESEDLKQNDPDFFSKCPK